MTEKNDKQTSKNERKRQYERQRTAKNNDGNINNIHKRQKDGNTNNINSNTNGINNKTYNR